MNTGPRIIFVNRFYWPDEPATAQLLTDLAEALAAAGHAVTVVTSRPNNYSTELIEVRNGVEIVRLSSLRPGLGHALLKALAFLSFSRGALRALSKRLQPRDVLVLMTDPPLLSWKASALAKKRGVRIVHWLQDIYPEIAMAVGGSSLAGVFRSRRDQAWRLADICVAPSEDMAGFARERGVNPQTILVSPNWAPAGLEPLPTANCDSLRREWGLAGKFVVMYSGNLGRVHDLHVILSIAEKLRNERDIIFIFVGDGAQRANLQVLANRRGLINVMFKPAQPRHRLGQTLSLANLHFITLRPGCERLVFPSKFYGIAAVGRPILYVGPMQCELARTIEVRDLGRAYSRNDTNSVAQTILHLRHAPADVARMSKAALSYSTEINGFKTAVSVWDRLLSGLKALAPICNTHQK